MLKGETNNTIWVSGIPKDLAYPENEIRELFSRAGDVYRVTAHIPEPLAPSDRSTDHTIHPISCEAAVEYRGVLPAATAILMFNGAVWAGSRLDAEYGWRNDSADLRLHGGEDISNEVVIFGLPRQIGLKSLADLFGQAGNVKRANVYKRAGISLRRGKVAFDSVESATKAIEMFNHRHIKDESSYTRVTVWYKESLMTRRGENDAPSDNGTIVEIANLAPSYANPTDLHTKMSAVAAVIEIHTWKDAASKLNMATVKYSVPLDAISAISLYDSNTFQDEPDYTLQVRYWGGQIPAKAEEVQRTSFQVV